MRRITERGAARILQARRGMKSAIQATMPLRSRISRSSTAPRGVASQPVGAAIDAKRAVERRDDSL